MNTSINFWVIKAGSLLKEKNLSLVIAESCTGGGLSHSISKAAHYSCVLERAYVVYSEESKRELLGVKNKTLQKYGAVSKETAKEMATGALKNSHAQISIAITGLLGTSSGSNEMKPVGTVYLCYVYKHSIKVICKKFYKHSIKVICKKFLGSRANASKKTLICALKGLYKFTKKIT